MDFMIIKGYMADILEFIIIFIVLFANFNDDIAYLILDWQNYVIYTILSNNAQTLY